MTAFYGDPSVAGRAEYARLRILLRDQPGGVDEVITELARLGRKLGGSRRKSRRKRLRRELTYFTNQRDRMDYAASQARGLPIGSGLVEAACKTLATQRLKRSGMSWRDGKQALLTLRSLQQSGRWSAAWGPGLSTCVNTLKIKGIMHARQNPYHCRFSDELLRPFKSA
jgi:hypothetical protein